MSQKTPQQKKKSTKAVTPITEVEILPPSQLYVRGASCLNITPGISQDDYESIGEQVTAAYKSASFALADWIVYGAENFPDFYLTACAKLGLAQSTVKNNATVARSFALEDRKPELTFEHHRILAPYKKRDPIGYEALVKKAVEENLTTAALKALIPKPPPPQPPQLTDEQKKAQEDKARLLLEQTRFTEAKSLRDFFLAQTPNKETGFLEIDTSEWEAMLESLILHANHILHQCKMDNQRRQTDPLPGIV